MAKIIMFGNSKGGVAKTTTAVNTADILASLGNKVLLVDMDPQGHCSIALNYDPLSHFNTIAHVLIGEIPIDNAIVEHTPQFHFIPSNINMFDTEEELKKEILSYFLLDRKLAPLVPKYDYILIDTPPNIGTFVLNSLIACQLLIVPVDSSFLGMEGYNRLEKVVTARIVPATRKPIPIKILLTLYDNRTRMSKDIRNVAMKKMGQDSVFTTVINRNTDVQKSLAQGVPIRVFCQENKIKAAGLIDYESFVNELVHMTASM